MPASISRSLPLSLAVLAVLAACTPDTPTSLRASGALLDRSSPAGKVALCHRPSSRGEILSVGAPALAAHLAHGDYLTTLFVSHEASQPIDGAHFISIGAALREARATRLAHDERTSAACRITIMVAADTYHGSTSGPASATDEQFPFVVDVPDITLHGALTMALDDAGRATGVGTDGAESVLSPTSPLPVIVGSSTPLIVVNGHPGGPAGNGAVIEGFVLQSGHGAFVDDAGGQGVLALRVQGLLIRGNRFEKGFTESMDIRASSGEVRENHLSGTAGTCDVCLAGPGRYRASGNYLLAGGIPGLGISGVVNIPVPSGVELYESPATAETWAELTNNEVHDHLRTPVGVGLRVDAVGIGAPDVYNTIHAVMRDNRIVNNRFGIIVHSAFAHTGNLRQGKVDVTLGGNEILGSCQAKLLVAFARHNTALGTANTPYMHDSTFRLWLNGDLSWSEVWYSHPAGLNNTLVVDGTVMDNGARQFYSKDACPGLQG
jgi:hypothetical protein